MVPRQDGIICGLDLNVVEVWRDYTGRGVTVAIYDDGVEATHPGLDGSYRARLELAGNNAAPDGTGADASGNPLDPHGTAVAGIVASELDGAGTVGVAFGAWIVSVDIREPPVGGQSPLMYEMDRYDVVNYSNSLNEPFLETLDGNSWRAELFDAVTHGRDHLGTIVVKSGGNSRRQNLDTGGTIDDVVRR